MPTIRILPKDDATNGWSRILADRAPKPALAGELRAEWAVVGAGFAGLAAARRLAENRPNDRVVLLEAGAVSEGASGRNSGFAIDVPHNVGASMDELDGSHRFLRLSRKAIDALRSHVAEHAIDCAWVDTGKIHAAASEKGRAEVLQPFAHELDALGEPYEWLDQATLKQKTGTDYFRSAIYTPGGALLNPAALVRGLAESLPENVTLHEGSPVVSIDYGSTIRLTTRGGSVEADQLILAVNGFAQEFGFYRGRLMSFASYGSLTRRLDDAERAALGGNDCWGLTPVNALAGVTMRFTPDRRILIRQDFRYAPRFRRPDHETDAVRAHHARILAQRFPMLPNVTLEHTWRGFVCLSRNHAPGFGRVAPKVYAAVCQNAVGVTKGTIGGMLAADLACGVDNALIGDMESLGTPSRLPPRPFMDVGVQATFTSELWRWRGEK